MGILSAVYPGQVRANPANFNPRDLSSWEWIVDDVAPDEDTFLVESGVATMSGYLKDHNLLWDALSYFVGYSEIDPASSVKVKRFLPAVHPRWPMMRCTTVSVKGVEFNGQVNPEGFYLGISYMKLPKYKRYRFDVHFEQPQMDYKEDFQCFTEWERMITIDPEDAGEMIVVDGGNYRYRAPTNPNLDGTNVVINGPFMRVYAQRSLLTVKAYGIPADFILNTNNLPVHFMAAKGKVNSTDFLGQPAGTMLLLNYKTPKRAQPIATSSLNTLLFGIDVEMTFGFTDPARAEPTETLRGWQLVPAFGGAGSVGWYGVQAAVGSFLYDTYDHNKLLQLWST